MMDKHNQKQLITEIMNEDAKDGLYKQQTAVDYLINKIKYLNKEVYAELQDDFITAKQIEREQIEKAYKDGYDDGEADYFDEKFKDGKDYYTKTYGQ